ncbi:MAG: hypothetical protein Q4G58_04140 [bacterium]|nr:hypothetical protein [bacterium]
MRDPLEQYMKESYETSKIPEFDVTDKVLTKTHKKKFKYVPCIKAVVALGIFAVLVINRVGIVKSAKNIINRNWGTTLEFKDGERVDLEKEGKFVEVSGDAPLKDTKYETIAEVSRVTGVKFLESSQYSKDLKYHFSPDSDLMTGERSIFYSPTGKPKYPTKYPKVNNEIIRVEAIHIFGSEYIVYDGEKEQMIGYSATVFTKNALKEDAVAAVGNINALGDMELLAEYKSEALDVPIVIYQVPRGDGDDEKVAEFVYNNVYYSFNAWNLKVEQIKEFVETLK